MDFHDCLSHFIDHEAAVPPGKNHVAIVTLFGGELVRAKIARIDLQQHVAFRNFAAIPHLQIDHLTGIF